ncbi:hypothetical protein ACFL3P_02815 [Pseudomonadota bacterium]
MKKGFDRLKGVAAASAIGFGLIGVGGSARAAVTGPTRSLGFTHRISLAATAQSQNLSASFESVGETSSSSGFGIEELVIWSPTGSFVNTWPAGSGTFTYTSGTWISGSWTITSTTTGPGYPSCVSGIASSYSAANTTGMGSLTNNACWWTTTSTTTGGYWSVTATLTGTSTWSAGSSSTSDAYDDAFDGVLAMEVDGQLFTNPDNTIDLTDDVVTSDVVNNIVGGIDAQIKFAFSGARGGSSMGGVAAMYILSNNSGTEKSITVNIFGDLGSDGGTMIQATDSGDFVADDADMWTVSNQEARGENPEFGDDPVLLITRYGKDASVEPTQTDVIADGNGSFANDYDLTIPAGETQRILVFIEAHSTIAGAEAAAADFESLAAAKSSGALEGLTTTAELKEVVNYKYVAPAADDDDGFLGATAPTLLGLLGIPALLRRFRKDK